MCSNVPLRSALSLLISLPIYWASARSSEAMQRLLNGASAMRTFFTQKLRDSEEALSAAKQRGADALRSPRGAA